MMERFLTEAGLLVRDVDANVAPDASNARLDYMWKARARPLFCRRRFRRLAWPRILPPPLPGKVSCRWQTK